MMPLTPADIHNMAFKKPPIGKRGYDEEEVDAFLDELEQELIRLIEENQVLQEQVQRSGPAAATAPGATGAAIAMEAELNDRIMQLERLQEARDRAEQNARNMQAQLAQARNAPPPAAAPPGEGSERTAAVLLMAQRTADDHMRDAEREVEALLIAARDKSAQITSEAQLTASTIESDARRNHTEAMNSLETNRNALLNEIERLGQLAQSYQAALNNHVTQQLQELNSVAESAG
jgi:DivIVA domain-containing protein